MSSAVHAVASEVGALGDDIRTDLHNTFQPTPKSLPPDLIQKVARAMFPSVMIYGIADIRRILREEEHEEHIHGDVSECHQFLTLPVKDYVIIKVIFENMKLLEKHIPAKSLDTYKAAIETYHAMDIPQQQPDGTNLPAPQSCLRQCRQSSELVVFDDTHSTKELVYAISVNRNDRIINVAFRGSVTPMDFIVDSELFITLVANPLVRSENTTTPTIPQPRHIGIHRGFYQYLFGVHGPSGTSKFQQIRDHIVQLGETFDGDFRLVCCGHSLGGAIATLFAFYMSFEEVIQDQVECTTFASPRVGNTQFWRAYQELELQKRLYHIRVANHRDIVTLHPDRLTLCTFPCQDSIFRHVGLELKLFPLKGQETHQISYIFVHRSHVRQLSDDFMASFWNTVTQIAGITCGCCHENYLQWHSCEEYIARLEKCATKMFDVSYRGVSNLKSDSRDDNRVSPTYRGSILEPHLFPYSEYQRNDQDS